MQTKKPPLGREIHEVPTDRLPDDYETKLARIRELTGMSDAEARSAALARGISSSFVLSILGNAKLH